MAGEEGEETEGGVEAGGTIEVTVVVEAMKEGVVGAEVEAEEEEKVAVVAAGQLLRKIPGSLL